MHVDRLKADCTVRYLWIGLAVVAVGTAAVVVAMRVDYDLLWLFRPPLANIAWPVIPTIWFLLFEYIDNVIGYGFEYVYLCVYVFVFV